MFANLNIQNMMKKTLIVLGLMMGFSSLQAQVSIVFSIGNDGNHLGYNILYLCDGSPMTKSRLDREVMDTAKVRYPAAKNYVADGFNSCGYLVILKSQWQDAQKFKKLRYAIGVGKDFKEAQKIAIANMKKRDRSWKESNGYDIERSLQLE
jgi:hypothetical protein